MHTRRRKFRRLISLSHHITFRLGRWFPKAIPLVYVLGYPKSGTSWACQLAADYLQLPFPQHAILPVGCPAVVHGHEKVTAGYPLGIYVVRDGRDVTISAFHHLKSQFLAGGGTREHRRFLKRIDLDLPLDQLLPKFIEHSVDHPTSGRLNWSQHD